VRERRRDATRTGSRWRSVLTTVLSGADEALLLACDGLFDVLPDAEVRIMLTL
jgi:serine/threonine protein phosphatase PrpC